MKLRRIPLLPPLLVAFFLITFGVGLVNYYLTHSMTPYRTVSMATILFAFMYWRLRQADAFISWLSRYIEKNALPLLAAWMALYLAWSGLVLFANPYRYEVNHGDAMFFSQTLWNLVDGFRPENSLFTMNGTSLVGEDPRYTDSHGYVSIFSMHQYWLPMAILAPLYMLFSQPPMHIFALIVCVIGFGLPGVYWAIRQAGGSKHFALLAAIGYSLLPQIEIQLFFKGYFDVLALGAMPWLFGALLGRKWALMYLFAFLVAAISLPHAQFVILFGLVILAFFQAAIPGALVMLIGLVMLKLDTSVFLTAVAPYYSAGSSPPSFSQHFVLDRTIGSLIDPIKINLAYTLSLLQAVAFLPLLVLRWNGRWNAPVAGFALLLGLAFVASLFRSYGWEFQRNSFFIVPVFMMGILACLSLSREPDLALADHKWPFRNIPYALLFFGVISAIFFGSPYNSPPLASHFPWGRGGYFLKTEETKKWDVALRQLNEIVPADATIAWQAGPEVQAILTNRQHSWVIGREPEGVKYYVFLGEAMNATEKQTWESLLARLRHSQSFKLLYEGIPGNSLIVFENLHAHPIPRNESLLGWNVLRGAFSGPHGLVNFSGRK